MKQSRHGPRKHMIDEDGLYPDEARFVVLVAKGYGQADAYRITHDCKDLVLQQIHERASRVAAKPQVRTRLHALLREARIGDVDSIGRAHVDLLEDMDAARREGNHTALAAYTRIRAQILGMLAEHLVITDERAASDDELVQRLAKGDPHKERLLRELVSDSDAYDVRELPKLSERGDVYTPE